MKKLTISEFISKSKKIHGELYDYTQVNYINAKTGVIIICNKHGEFLQTPDNHTSGYGCNRCGVLSSANSKRKPNNFYIKKSVKIHGNKYDYSKFIYTGNKDKACIICPEHGEFWQVACDHIRGAGCPACGIIKTANSKRKSITQFIKEAISIHGKKYNYDRTTYVHAHKKIIITCPEHGDFEQTPNSHLHHGCPSCAHDLYNVGYNYKNFKRNPKLADSPGVLYLVIIKLTNEEFIKIGITAKDVKTRFNNNSKITALMEFHTSLFNAFRLEQQLLNSNLLKTYKYTPVKNMSGKTECFNINSKLLLLNLFCKF